MSDGEARVDLQRGFECAASLPQVSGGAIQRGEIDQDVNMSWHERAGALIELDGSGHIALVCTHAGEHHQAVGLGTKALEHRVGKLRGFIPCVALQGCYGTVDEFACIR